MNHQSPEIKQKTESRSIKKAIITVDTLAIGFVALDCVLNGDPLSPVGPEADLVLLPMIALMESVDILDAILPADAELTLAAMLVGILELDAETMVVEITADVDNEDTAAGADDVPNGNGVGRAGVKVLVVRVLENTTGVPNIVVALLYISGTATVSV